MDSVNPAAGVLAPAPGRLTSPPLLRPDPADRIRVFLLRRLVVHRPTLDLVLPLAVLSLVSMAGTAAAPALWDSPLLLMALTPRLPFLMVAAPRTGLLPFLVVGTARLCLADPFHFRLGRRMALSTGGGAGRGRARCARMVGHRLARPAAAALVLVRPNGRHLALAGAVGLRVTVVAAFDLAGTALYLVGIHGAAGLLG
jgi:hypothetical protein